MDQPKFCFVCAKPLRMGYPGNDPESGPACLRCPAGHDTIEEHIYPQRRAIFLDYLEVMDDEIKSDPDDDTPQEVSDAVRCLLAHFSDE
jgi:hypothetical protein